MLTNGVLPPSFPDLSTLYCNPEDVSTTPSLSLFSARNAFPSCTNNNKSPAAERLVRRHRVQVLSALCVVYYYGIKGRRSSPETALPAKTCCIQRNMGDCRNRHGCICIRVNAETKHGCLTLVFECRQVCSCARADDVVAPLCPNGIYSEKRRSKHKVAQTCCCSSNSIAALGGS